MPYLLVSERMGHDVPGMRGVYGHPTAAMRSALNEVLEACWATSLQERARLGARSLVPVLDALLAFQRGIGRQDRLTRILMLKCIRHISFRQVDRSLLCVRPSLLGAWWVMPSRLPISAPGVAGGAHSGDGLADRLVQVVGKNGRVVRASMSPAATRRL